MRPLGRVASVQQRCKLTLFLSLHLWRTIARAVALTEPYKEIAPKVPTGSLLSPRILISLIAQIFFQAVAQVVLYLVLKQQPW